MSGAVLQGHGVNCVCHALAVLLRESSRESFGGWKLGGLDDALDTQKCLRASNARIRGFSILAASVGKILGSSLFARTHSAGPLVTRGQADSVQRLLF